MKFLASRLSRKHNASAHTGHRLANQPYPNARISPQQTKHMHALVVTPATHQSNWVIRITVSTSRVLQNQHARPRSSTTLPTTHASSRPADKPMSPAPTTAPAKMWEPRAPPWRNAAIAPTRGTRITPSARPRAPPSPAPTTAPPSQPQPRGPPWRRAAHATRGSPWTEQCASLIVIMVWSSTRLPSHVMMHAAPFLAHGL